MNKKCRKHNEDPRGFPYVRIGIAVFLLSAVISGVVFHTPGGQAVWHWGFFLPVLSAATSGLYGTIRQKDEARAYCIMWVSTAIALGYLAGLLVTTIPWME